MKTHHLRKTPPIDPAELSLPANGHSLKAYFCGCAVIGRISCEEARLFETTPETIVNFAATHRRRAADSPLEPTPPFSTCRWDSVALRWV
jgi:hypothetical protein